ncbi:hypothetical protein [Paenibacillus xylaniclasticus]|uniref:hypothetical protein n=1 Tax=Paenibacillus xylaniclasticus TaxID=588083 RepID=UPI000FDBCC0E|nr:MULTISPECIES: hypothetical protein [Paenibacillus]GFN32570.1 hypothetical protein PCURB6_28300 [Paenibacillus curdlanolyticus]
MLSVVGLGQAGSNIAAEAHSMGISSGAINFSQKDLDAVEVKHKLRLLGSEGVGKNRDSAIKLFQDQWEVAVNFIKDYFANSKVVVFAFSSSGGSGSGVSPILLDIVRQLMPEITFAAFAILPESSEATTSQINCLKTFEELNNIDCAIFPIDNQQIRKFNPSVGKNKLYELSNRESIRLLNQIVSYTSLHSKNGNFDVKDLITVLNTRGIATISEANISSLSQGVDLTPEGVASKVISSWVTSPFTPIQNEKVTKAAIIFDGQESLLEAVRHELMFSGFKNGIHDLFEGYYHEHSGKIVSLLTGLSWCSERLNDIELSIKNNQDNLVSTLTTNEQYRFEADWISQVKAVTSKPTKKQSISDILNKYNR